MDRLSLPPSITRRDVLKASGAVVAAGLVGGSRLLAPETARAQTPKRGGTFRLVLQSDPVTGFDPHQTISFVTMVPLSFAYSRLVKVKAGPSVKPMTYPIEPDLAESWTQPDDKTYVFKLKKGVRWHPKPPVNGRELTADDVKYTYERFLTIKGNGNRPVLEYVDRPLAHRIVEVEPGGPVERVEHTVRLVALGLQERGDALAIPTQPQEVGIAVDPGQRRYPRARALAPHSHPAEQA